MPKFQDLLSHLTDLRDTVSLFNELNVEFHIPDFLEGINLYVGQSVVSSFSDALLFRSFLLAN